MKINICEEKIFEQLYHANAVALRNFIYYKTGSLQVAEDITQDAFSKLWQNCSKVIFAKAKSFVFTAANNLFLNRVKHQKVVLKFESSVESVRTNSEDPQFLLEQVEFKKKLEKAISALNEKHRVVFLMNRIDKMTYKQIADTLNISVKAVEKRMHNALKVLKSIHQKI